MPSWLACSIFRNTGTSWNIMEHPPRKPRTSPQNPEHPPWKYGTPPRKLETPQNVFVKYSEYLHASRVRNKLWNRTPDEEAEASKSCPNLTLSQCRKFYNLHNLENINILLFFLRAYLYERVNEENGGGEGKIPPLFSSPLDSFTPSPILPSLDAYWLKKGRLAVYPLLQELTSGIVLKIAICETD